ncbi:MAG: response regulator [Opitutae bacterium]|nr:response regulator [Opitutae bacterium]
MSQPLRVLQVEDSESDAELIIYQLTQAGYAVVSERVDAAAQMREALARQKWDVVISDYRMPQFDAPAALKILQQSGLDLPFIVVSGTIGEEIAVAMMKAGAHDYVMKTALARLAPAIARELREAQQRHEKRQAEVAFLQSEERYRLLFNSANDAVLVYHLAPDGTGGRFFEVNDIACARLGYTREELLQRTPADIGLVGIGAAVAAGDQVYITKTGTRVPVEVSTHRFEFLGQPAVLATVRDITARREMEEKLRQAQKMEAVGQLAGGIAHDFNNILAGTMMQLGLLLENPQLSPEIRETVEELELETQRAANLTQQLLLFSRRQIVETKPVDLQQVLANLLKMLRRLIGENIRLSLVEPSTPCWVQADPGMMEQIVMNLCVNARDAMPQGGALCLDLNVVELSAEAVVKDINARPGSFVCLSVTDNGHGMDAATRERIFEPFFTTKGPGKGTGLGLATVYGIAKQHHGWVAVESAPGCGTSFHVYLPALTLPEPTSPTVIQPDAVRGGSETILLVEDEGLVRCGAATILKRLGYRVVEAANGHEALACWVQQAGAIDLLLTDMVMPEGMTGLTLAETLRVEKPGLPVVVASGYSVDLVNPERLDAANIVYIAKPFTKSALSAVVRKALDRT